MKRNSNFELLRIISMFMIVVWHIILHGFNLDNTTGGIHFILDIIICIFVVHVNSFILITGYHLYNKEIKYKKVVMLLLEVLFYNVLSLILMKIFNLEYEGYYTVFSLKSYWFIQNYLILYCLAPFINKLIKVLTKEDYQLLICTVVIIFFVIPSFTSNEILVNNGYNIQQFVILYLIGAYISKYDFNPLKNLNLKKQNTIYIISIITCIIFRLSVFYLFKYIDTNGIYLFNHFKDVYIMKFRDYTNIIVVIQSVLVLLIFKNINLKCSYINEISKTTLGIYLMHENVIIKNNIYKLLKVAPLKSTQISQYFIKIFLVAILIFLVCSLIERIRQALFDDRKYYNKFIEKITNSLNFVK